MERILRKVNLGKCILALVLVSSVFVLAGDVVVKEGIGIFDKIGIGTTSPSEALDLASGNLTTTGSGTFGSLTVDTDILYVDATNNRIGIGTTSPSQALDLASGNLTTTGTIEGEKFQSTSCTATSANAVALGANTAAIGVCSTAMGYQTTASGVRSTAMGETTTASAMWSTAIGKSTTASGMCSIAMGLTTTAGPADWTTAIGRYSINNVANSLTVGYGSPGEGNDKVDFRVRSDLVNVYGDLEVDDDLNVKGTYKANGTAGWSGWFDDGTNFRVTVTNGIITAVTDSVSAGHNP